MIPAAAATAAMSSEPSNICATKRIPYSASFGFSSRFLPRANAATLFSSSFGTTRGSRSCPACKFRQIP